VCERVRVSVYVRVCWPVKSGRFFLAFMIRCPCFSVASSGLFFKLFHHKARRGRGGRE
jgi:hypothetical protein